MTEIFRKVEVVSSVSYILYILVTSYLEFARGGWPCLCFRRRWIFEWIPTTFRSTYIRSERSWSWRSPAAKPQGINTTSAYKPQAKAFRKCIAASLRQNTIWKTGAPAHCYCTPFHNLHVFSPILCRLVSAWSANGVRFLGSNATWIVFPYWELYIWSRKIVFSRETPGLSFWIYYMYICMFANFQLLRSLYTDDGSIGI